MPNLQVHLPARRLAPAITALVLFLLLSVAGGSPAWGCSRDDGAYLDTFPDDACLVTPLDQDHAALDPLGGVRLATNGQSTTDKWDTDGEFANGLAYQGSTFGPVGVSTLATSGTGASGKLGLADTFLALSLDAGAAGSGGVVLDTADRGPGAAEDGDDVSDPAIVRVGGTYHLYYAGVAEDGSGPAIFHATSTDGQTWNNREPMLRGTKGAFDEHGVSGAEVVYTPGDPDGEWRMWYTGAGPVYAALGYATSTDGSSWTKHEAGGVPTPVLTHGPAGSADSFGPRDATVLKDGETWRMWYTGDDSTKRRILYATSPDGVTWEKGGTVIAAEDLPQGNAQFGAFSPTVWKDGTTFRMLFAVRDVQPNGTIKTKLVNTSSSDGIDWQPISVALNPTNGSFDETNVDSPDAFVDGNGLKVYYSGNSVDANGNAHTQIGLADSGNQSGGGLGKVGQVLGIGQAATEFDARGVSGLSVVAAPTGASSTYVGFYAGTRGSDFKPRIGAATSGDGSAWTRAGGNGSGGSQLDLGNPASFTNGGERDPSPLHIASTYHVFFTAIDASGERSIGRASTGEAAGKLPDATAWATPNSSSLAKDGSGFDSDGVEHPSVADTGAGLVMAYTGIDATGVRRLGRAVASGPTGTWTRDANALLTLGPAGSFDHDGMKDPVLLRVGASDWRLLYTGIEKVGDKTIERIGYATSTDGVTFQRAGAGVVLNPSQVPYAADENGVNPSGALVDNNVLHVWYAGTDRTGRQRGLHATAPVPVPASPQAAVPSGWATYQLGDASTSVRDFRSITRTSSGSGVQLWMSFLQPYSSVGQEYWSDYFPVTADDIKEKLDFLLTVRGVRWQARVSDPSGSLDTVELEHAPVSFHQAGSATTKTISPPDGSTLLAWKSLTVKGSLLKPEGTGTGGGTVRVKDATGQRDLASAPLNTNGDTTIDLSQIAAPSNQSLIVRLELTSDGAATPLVGQLKASYSSADCTATPAACANQPQCSNGTDDDGDGKIDFPADSGCQNAADTTEADPPPAPCPQNPDACPLQLTLSADKSVVTYGETAQLKGALTRGGRPVSGTVSLAQRPLSAAAFSPLPGAPVDGSGNYASTVTPTVGSAYQASFPQAPTPPAVTIQVRHKITLSARRRGTRLYLRGRVAPNHPRRTVTVQIRKSTGWVTFTKLKTSSRSTFSAVRSIRARGKYRFRARVAGDGEHLAGTSPIAYVERHRVTLSAALSGRRATFSGRVAPGHPGKTAYLKERTGTRWVTVAKLRLSTRSTFATSRRLTRGTHAFRVDMPADRLHYGGSSLTRTLTVT